MKASYLEMLGDKEREAVDGFDGTIVVDGDSVKPAMVEFNKSMPRANQQIEAVFREFRGARTGIDRRAAATAVDTISI